MQLTFIDLFSGIGGFRRGMEVEGHKCVGHCEWDKYADTSYRAIHDVKEGEWFCGDIRKANADDIPKCDVWCFGAPCQDFSIAGERKGLDGDRSSLVKEVFRLIRDTKEENRPKYLIYENVKGMLSSNKGWDFAFIIIEMEELGYNIEYQVLNSKDFGVPQNRERVFTVGHLRGRSTRKVFPINGTAGENSLKQIVGGSQGNRVYSIDGVGSTLSANGGGQGAKTGLYAIPVLTLSGVNKRQNGRRFKEPGDPMFTLTAQDRHGVAIKVGNTSPSGKSQCNDVFSDKGIYPTLLAGTHGNCNSSILTNCRIRKLTPLECWKLQGWSNKDFYKAKKSLCDTYYKGKDKADSQLYKQAGNGVTTTVIREIAKRL